MDLEPPLGAVMLGSVQHALQFVAEICSQPLSALCLAIKLDEGFTTGEKKEREQEGGEASNAGSFEKRFHLRVVSSIFPLSLHFQLLAPPPWPLSAVVLLKPSCPQQPVQSGSVRPDQICERPWNFNQAGEREGGLSTEQRRSARVNKRRGRTSPAVPGVSPADTSPTNWDVAQRGSFKCSADASTFCPGTSFQTS